MTGVQTCALPICNMVPIHAKCVTFDAGYAGERKRARETFTLGEVYTIRSMYVGSSSTTLEFYDIPGHWNNVFFDPISWGEYLSGEEEEDDELTYVECPEHGHQQSLNVPGLTTELTCIECI